MAELLVQETSLTTVADAIREKADITGKLTFPNGFVSAIAALGAVPESITAIASGEFTPASTKTTPIAIAHGLGVAPNIMFAFPNTDLVDEGEYSGTEMLFQFILYQATCDGEDTFGNRSIYYRKTGGSTFLTKGSDNPIADHGGSNDTRCYFYASQSAIFKVGTTYRWIAAHVEFYGGDEE